MEYLFRVSFVEMVKEFVGILNTHGLNLLGDYKSVSYYYIAPNIVPTYSIRESYSW